MLTAVAVLATPCAGQHHRFLSEHLPTLAAPGLARLFRTSAWPLANVKAAVASLTVHVYDKPSKFGRPCIRTARLPAVELVPPASPFPGPTPPGSLGARSSSGSHDEPTVLPYLPDTFAQAGQL